MRFLDKSTLRRLAAWLFFSLIALALAVYADQFMVSEVRWPLTPSMVRPLGRFLGLNPYVYLAVGFCIGGFVVLGIKVLFISGRHKIAKFLMAIFFILPWILIWIATWLTGDWFLWISILSFEAMLELGPVTKKGSSLNSAKNPQ